MDNAEVSYFGIDGYEPRWLAGSSIIDAAHGPRLRALTGHVLRHVWLLWDIEDDEWFADAPVLLDFGHEQVEISHQKFADLSVTWNTISPAKQPAWTSGVFQLAWRDEARADASAHHGHRLDAVELLEYAGSNAAHGMTAISFVFSGNRLTVSNGLDENDLEFGGPDPAYRRTPL
ncbi:hypothetical protein [Lentzea sp. HUAS12]|uniref:hypothetical protein n=1 Tax=Lentzea sp. HUAS12 TaxID=2951806 RepID=UPI0020A216B6|nr:hypothetical protein [Lentzea sp. HUAS12]USX52365.1 hypothetical protein ND450_44845 [Lentzea sp. HUAS12]